MSKAALTTKKLIAGYPGSVEKVLFESLDLELHKGQLVCFMGPNGIGKSTLIRTLAGAQKPLAGEVNGVDSKNVAVVLTDRINAGSMRVKDLVSYGRYPYLNWSIRMDGEDYAKIDEAVKQVGIGYLMEQPIHELSDGQLQMVMIAKALAQDTPVLLLDEPTAHLDLNNRVEVMNLLRRLAKANDKAILVSTHELDLALQTADLVWLATSEKKIQTGVPEDLVLDGTFDRVFQFKGFDLKTGKVKQEAFRKVSVQLSGEGHAYLWTKNALERNGFQIEDNAPILIEVLKKDKFQWKLIGNNQSIECSNLSELLSQLDTTEN